jgi:hypothetical protein
MARSGWPGRSWGQRAAALVAVVVGWGVALLAGAGAAGGCTACTGAGLCPVAVRLRAGGCGADGYACGHADQLCAQAH